MLDVAQASGLLSLVRPFSYTAGHCAHITVDADYLPADEHPESEVSLESVLPFLPISEGRYLALPTVVLQGR